MSKIIEQFKNAKTEMGYSEGWAEMLGKPYHGGGGGVGKLVKIQLQGRPELYYQYRDGDKNYHEAPLCLLKYLEAAIAARFPELLAGALALQKADLQVLAAAALREHQELLREAGLVE